MLRVRQLAVANKEIVTERMVGSPTDQRWFLDWPHRLRSVYSCSSLTPTRGVAQSFWVCSDGVDSFHTINPRSDCRPYGAESSITKEARAVWQRLVLSYGHTVLSWCRNTHLIKTPQPLYQSPDLRLHSVWWLLVSKQRNLVAPIELCASTSFAMSWARFSTTSSTSSARPRFRAVLEPGNGSVDMVRARTWL